MGKDTYIISRESLSEILSLAEDMLEWGCFVCEDYRINVDSFRGDVVCDGVESKLKQDYIGIYKLVNIVCNDGRIR